jgi:hypothetical protein
MLYEVIQQRQCVHDGVSCTELRTRLMSESELQDAMDDTHNQHAECAWKVRRVLNVLYLADTDELLEVPNELWASV